MTTRADGALGEGPLGHGAAPDELLGELTDELSELIACNVELAARRQAPALRKIGVEVAVAAAAGTALLLALVAASWAAIRGLEIVVPVWAAPLIVCGGWLVVTLLLLALEHPRRLIRRLREPDQAVDTALRDRLVAERAVGTTAERLMRTLATQTLEREVGREVELVEHEADIVFREVVSLAVAPIRIWIGALERLAGRAGGTADGDGKSATGLPEQPAARR